MKTNNLKMIIFVSLQGFYYRLCFWILEKKFSYYFRLCILVLLMSCGIALYWLKKRYLVRQLFSDESNDRQRPRRSRRTGELLQRRRRYRQLSGKFNSPMLALSTDNHCKQFEPRSGPTKCWACSGSKLFDTLMIFLKEFLIKLILIINQQTTKTCKIASSTDNHCKQFEPRSGPTKCWA